MINKELVRSIRIDDDTWYTLRMMKLEVSKKLGKNVRWNDFFKEVLAELNNEK